MFVFLILIFIQQHNSINLQVVQITLSFTTNDAEKYQQTYLRKLITKTYIHILLQINIFHLFICQLDDGYFFYI